MKKMRLFLICIAGILSGFVISFRVGNPLLQILLTAQLITFLYVLFYYKKEDW